MLSNFFPTPEQRFREVREKDDTDRNEFIKTIVDKNTQATRDLNTVLNSTVLLWRSEMEVLVSSPEDRDWLDMLCGQYKIMTERTGKTFEGWLGNLTREKCIEFNRCYEKTLQEAIKTFKTKSPSLEWLNAVVAERQAIVFRGRLGIMIHRDTLISEYTKTVQQGLVGWTEMFTQIFQKAIE